jgi:hypothetical protein
VLGLYKVFAKASRKLTRRAGAASSADLSTVKVNSCTGCFGDGAISSWRSPGSWRMPARAHCCARRDPRPGGRGLESGMGCLERRSIPKIRSGSLAQGGRRCCWRRFGSTSPTTCRVLAGWQRWIKTLRWPQRAGCDEVGMTTGVPYIATDLLHGKTARLSADAFQSRDG